MGILALVISILTGALGQIFFKQGIGLIKTEGWQFYLDILKNGWMYLGFLSYGVSFLTWMQVLKHYDVSFARPLTGLGYILTYALALIFLGESLTWQRIVGTVLITAGVILMK